MEFFFTEMAYTSKSVKMKVNKQPMGSRIKMLTAKVPSIS